MTAFPAREGGCQEADLRMPAFPCNEDATHLVSWPTRGEGPYRMCDMCTDHSVRNRGATAEHIEGTKTCLTLATLK